MRYILRILVIFMLISSSLVAKDNNIEISTLIGNTRSVVRAIFLTPEKSNDTIDTYFHRLIFSYNKENIVDGITLTRANHKKEKTRLMLMNLTIGDKINKVKKLYGNNYQFFHSWPDDYTGIWTINDKMLIIDFQMDAYKYSISSITCCKMDSFVAMIYVRGKK